jgi:hypothetical protein
MLAGKPVTCGELAQLMNVSNGEASKRIQAAANVLHIWPLDGRTTMVQPKSWYVLIGS